MKQKLAIKSVSISNRRMNLSSCLSQRKRMPNCQKYYYMRQNLEFRQLKVLILNQLLIVIKCLGPDSVKSLLSKYSISFLSL